MARSFRIQLTDDVPAGRHCQLSLENRKKQLPNAISKPLDTLLWGTPQDPSGVVPALEHHNVDHDGHDQQSGFTKMIPKFLHRSYGHTRSPRLRQIIRREVTRLEGGELISTTLRSILADYHGVEIGLYSYGGCFEPRNIPSGTTIGRYGSFSRFRVFSRDHPLNFISMHPFFFNTNLGYVKSEIVPHTHLAIGHDVWIGYGVVILSGVSTIGNGAVIGAGTIVTHDVPPYGVVVGNPGRVVKYRFCQEIISRIEATKWWDWSIEELANTIDLFTRPVSLADLDRVLGFG